MFVPAKLLSLTAVLAVVLASGERGATAQQADTRTVAAEALFEQGRQLMKEKKFAEACEKFAASNEAESSVGALLNLGECQTRIGRTASAWTAYRQAAALAQKDKDRRRAAFASRRADALERELSYLIVEVAGARRTDGMTISRGESEVLEPLWNQRIPVDPGTYTISATAPGHLPWSAQVTVQPRSEGGAGEVRVSVPALEPAPAPERAVTAEPETPGEPARSPGLPPAPAPRADDGGLGTGRVVAIGSGVVGLAGIATGVVFALQSQSKNDQAYDDGHCDAMNACDAAGVALVEDARSAASVSYVAYGVGVAAVAVGAVLWFTSGPAETDDANAHSARVRPALGPGLAGIELIGRF